MKAGLSCSTTLFRNNANYYANGLLIGITSDVNLGNHFFISPQLYYSQKGNTTAVASTFRINYLNLPILCGYRITNHLQFLLGFDIGILLNGRLNQGDTIFNTTDRFQKIDPGFDAGLRYAFGRWGFDFSYVRSLIGIEKSRQKVYVYDGTGNLYEEYATISEKDKSKNQTFEFSIYYFFGNK